MIASHYLNELAVLFLFLVLLYHSALLSHCSLPALLIAGYVIGSDLQHLIFFGAIQELSGTAVALDFTCGNDRIIGRCCWLKKSLELFRFKTEIVLVSFNQK